MKEILRSSEGPVQEQALESISAPIDKIALICNADIDKMKVDELRTALEIRGVNKMRSKKDLVETLKHAMADKVQIIDKETTCTSFNGFPPNARWELIDSSALDTVHDSINDVMNAHSLNDLNDLAFGRKINYKECWCRELFDPKCHQPLLG